VTAAGRGYDARMRGRWVAGVLALGLIAGGPSTAAALPPVKHVVIVIMENENYDSTFAAASKAPYLSKTLTSQGAFLRNFYAIGHLSLDNYIALVSGQAPNPITQSDCQIFQEFAPGTPAADGQYVGQGCVYPRAVTTIANQLESKGLTWKGYMEDMANGGAGEAKACRHPPLNGQDHTQSAEKGDQYAARHNPFVYFHSIIDFPTCAKNDVDFRELASDLSSASTTPSYAFITPNLCNDGHDEPCVDDQPGGLVQIDKWLREHVPAILAAPGFKDDGLLIVTFDEAEGGPGGDADASACCDEQPGPNTPNPGGPTMGPGGGKIGAVLLSPFIRPGTVIDTPYNHYSLLRSVEDLFGLSHLGYAGQEGLKPFDDAIFNAQPGPAGSRRLTLRVGPRRLRRRHRSTLRIKVSDPASVTVAGACRRKTRPTGADRRLRMAVRPRGRRRSCSVKASRPGFRSAKRRLRVRRPRR
jgi:phosphatidylinositol-3-phosphatase